MENPLHQRFPRKVRCDKDIAPTALGYYRFRILLISVQCFQAILYIQVVLLISSNAGSISAAERASLSTRIASRNDAIDLSMSMCFG